MTIEAIRIQDRATWDACLARFEEKFIPEPMSGCWLWIAGLVPDGYGSFYWPFDGRVTLKAHRASWILYRGPLLDEEQVLHRCDTRCCVNPDHLFKGDNAANVADRVAKGRSAFLRGSHQGRAKLTEDAAAAIYTDPRTSKVIAEEYGVSVFPVRAIKRRQLWVHATSHLWESSRAN